MSVEFKPKEVQKDTIFFWIEKTLNGNPVKCVI